MEVKQQETVKEWLEGLADSRVSAERDSAKMQNLLHRVGFPLAVCAVGVVYLEGKGTLDAPPTSIHQIAGWILKTAEES